MPRSLPSTGHATPVRHLVVAGAGHAHLDLLAALTAAPIAGWTVTLVMPTEDFAYSGSLPAVIAGTAPESAALIPIGAAARAAKLRVIISSVTALDAAAQVVTLANGESLAFDLLSLDVGSAPVGLGGVDGAEFAFTMRPFRRALELTARLDAVAAHVGRGARVPVAVVGAGAAGVEIACALRTRLQGAGVTPVVTLIDPNAADHLPLPGSRMAVRQHAGRLLADRGIAVVQGTVTAIGETSLRVRNAFGEEVDHDVCATAWTTGAAAHSWLAASGLACDDRGFPLAEATLALNASETIFGGGDCVTLRDATGTAKAGVYAVRMAPILAANVLGRTRQVAAQRRYTPQHDFLALLSTGDGEAMLRWKGITLTSRWAQKLKTRIDTGYMARYSRRIAGDVRAAF
jgi:NADH dehydrogenase FAD-containing subunit